MCFRLLNVIRLHEMSDELDDLSTVDWVEVPDTSFIVKCKFSDVGYSVLMSDLTHLYGERIRESEVQERFCKLNPYAEMKTSVIIKNVKETLEEGLRVKTSTLTLHQLPEKLVLRLEFKAAQVSFIYDLELGLLSADQLRDNILVPTILNALLNHQKHLELKKKYEALENGQLLPTSMN
ncbi:uncharacterized protein LOC118201517, partial [Stegodyphus dumicola]|uniref:uncharacterized protein LOC118201517 n=1 Tax=Stegodyphus dumicola TaxID=202533 RepID=UPI0015AAD5E6